MKIEGVLLAGESIVNQALQPCPVKHSTDYFKRLALGASQYPETLTGLYCALA
jgi:hypothetical protein